jgi:hypothetical protein
MKIPFGQPLGLTAVAKIFSCDFPVDPDLMYAKQSEQERFRSRSAICIKDCDDDSIHGLRLKLA